MTVYQIDYDLRKNRDYQSLYERIMQLGGYCHALESTWFVTSSKTAAQIRDHLRPAIDNDDGLVVSGAITEAAWHGLSREVADWLKSNIGRR